MKMKQNDNFNFNNVITYLRINHMGGKALTGILFTKRLVLNAESP